MKHTEIIAGDRLAPLTGETMPVTVILDRLRSAFNTGNIFRLCDAVRAESVVTCGYTPSPPHPKLGKTARGCHVTVPSTKADTALEAVRDYRQRGYTVYAVETAVDAIPFYDLKLTFPAAFLLGNEALGVSEDALAITDKRVNLPCLGVKNSINVGNCAAVMLYEALRQWQRSRHE